MEKHVQHFMHSFMHIIPFLMTMFKASKVKEENRYLGDNFPTGIKK